MMTNLRSLLAVALALSLILSLGALPALAQDERNSSACTRAEFDRVLLFVADDAVPFGDLSGVGKLDPDFSFLRETMGFNDAAIARFRHEAEIYFRDRFGFDFTNVPADANNVKALDGVIPRAHS